MLDLAAPRFRRAVVLISAALALAAVGNSIAQKERQLATGRTALLALAPVDPRSLMQGDYMALRFALAQDIAGALGSRNPQAAGTAWSHDDSLVVHDGKVVVAPDAAGIARFVRLDDGAPLAEGEFALQYRIRAGQVRFATNAFFFQEGDASWYEAAAFGEFRVAEDGGLLLTALRGPEQQPLGPQHPRVEPTWRRAPEPIVEPAPTPASAPAAAPSTAPGAAPSTTAEPLAPDLQATPVEPETDG